MDSCLSLSCNSRERINGFLEEKQNGRNRSKLGETVCFENGSSGGIPAKSGQVPAEQLQIPAKKARSTAQNVNHPRCQVEGCGVDLSSAKAYHLRHRVCGDHSKSSKVFVGGLEQRFCQQCSRFHELPEFDEGKRSCRRRLASHNQRRRKPQPDPTTLFSNCSQFAAAAPLYGHLGSMRANSYRDQVDHVEAELPRPTFNSNVHKLLPHSVHGLVSEVSPQGCLYEVGRGSGGERLLGVLDSDCALSLLSTEWKGAGSAAGEILAGGRPFPQSFQNLNLGFVSDELLGVCLQSSNLQVQAHNMFHAPWS